MAVTNQTSSSARSTRGAAGAADALSHELDAPPWLRVESTLMATANAIRDEYDLRLAPLGLTLSTASLLSYIGEFGPVSQTRAAEHLGQGRAVTGTQVDKLESLGMVERRPDPADRRVWLVAITDAGRELATSISQVDEVFRAELRDGISRADRQTLATLLVRLHHNIHRSHIQTPDNQAPDIQTPDVQTPHHKTPDNQTPDNQTEETT